jgi:hypothetical protein
METPSLTAAVRRELLTHPEVTEAAHRFGGIVFHLGGRELGHLHGETRRPPAQGHMERDPVIAISPDPAPARPSSVRQPAPGPGPAEERDPRTGTSSRGRAHQTSPAIVASRSR